VIVGRRRAISPIAHFLVAAIGAGLLLTLLPSALSLQTARADEAPVRVTITGMAPVALTTGTSLTLRGTVANTGLTDVTSVSVRLVLASTPVPERRLLRKATDAEAEYGSYPVYGTNVVIAETLAPGAKADYRVTVGTDVLALSAPGVYVVGVEAVGYSAAGYVILGSERTLIPFVPEPVAPVNVTWLWPLATWPGQTADNVLLGDLIPRELSPGGRLDDILRAGASIPSVSWVVDPQVLQVASEMSDGYLVDKGGETRAGAASQAAADWLQLARQTLSEPQGRGAQARPLWTLPYADPDADAVVRAGLTTDLVRAATSGPSLASTYLGREPDGGIAWAAGGRLDREAIDVLASAGLRTAVVRARSVPNRADIGYTPSGYVDVDSSAGRVRALVIDSGLLGALEMPQGNQGTVLAARQRFLAELAFVALEPTTQTRYLVAAAASPRWDPNPRLLRAIIASLRSTPWTRLTPVETLLALPPTTTVTTLDAGTQRGRELEGTYLARVQDLQNSLESLRTVLSDPLRVTTPITSALLRAESSAWRSRPRGGEELISSIADSITDVEDGIYVVARDNVTFSGDRGSVPVTVANDLDQAVTVGVSVRANTAARLVSESLAPVQIEPGRRASLEVPVRIVGGEALIVEVQLTNPTGEAFGTPVALELRTTAYSRAALWVAIAAAVVLVLLVVFDIVRRSRQRRASRSAPTA
jgi:hypothetical protein